MTDIGLDGIFNSVCVLVTAAFALTLMPGFRRSERSLISVHDQGTALLVFLVLGLVEELPPWALTFAYQLASSFPPWGLC
jgi:hypothetical protein